MSSTESEARVAAAISGSPSAASRSGRLPDHVRTALAAERLVVKPIARRRCLRLICWCARAVAPGTCATDADLRDPTLPDAIANRLDRAARESLSLSITSPCHLSV